MEAPKIHEAEKIQLSSLNFASYNPRVTMPPDKMRALKASLLKHGLVLNLVVQKKGLTLIGGHQRVKALRELCEEHGWPPIEKAPAVILDVSDAQAKVLNVALNRIDNDFDPLKLGELFASVTGLTAEDVASTGFSQTEVESLIKLTLPPEEVMEPEEEEVGTFAKSVTLTVEFDTVEQRDKAKEILLAAAKARGTKAGAVLLEAIKAHKAVKGKRAA